MVFIMFVDVAKLGRFYYFYYRFLYAIPGPFVYFWIGKRDRHNRCDVIFAIRQKPKKEERRVELSMRPGKKRTEGIFDRKVSFFGKTST